jgi:hypothetical protein
MSAWSKDLDKIPTDGTHVLMRHPDWECLAVVKYGRYDEWSGWLFVETLISDAAGSVDEELLPTIEWAHIPS